MSEIAGEKLDRARRPQARVLPYRMSVLAARFRQTIPTAGSALFGAVLWALAMFGCAAAGLRAEGWQSSEQARLVIGLFAAGAFVAFPMAIWNARFLMAGRSREVAFAAMFVALSFWTIAITGAIFAFQYRLYYSQWHAEIFSRVWFFQFAFTTAGALYQFAVLGTRLYGAIGIAALFAFSFWFARQTR